MFPKVEKWLFRCLEICFATISSFTLVFRIWLLFIMCSICGTKICLIEYVQLDNFFVNFALMVKMMPYGVSYHFDVSIPIFW